MLASPSCLVHAEICTKMRIKDAKCLEGEESEQKQRGIMGTWPDQRRQHGDGQRWAGGNVKQEAALMVFW